MIASCSVTITGHGADGETDYRNTVFTVQPLRKMGVDSAQDLWIFFKTMVDGGVLRLVVDMGDTAFIDSAGIGTLINAAKIIRQKGGNLALIRVSRDILAILDMVSFRKFIPVFDTQEDAMRHFAGISEKMPDCQFPDK